MLVGCGATLALVIAPGAGTRGYWGGEEPNILFALMAALPGVSLLGILFTVPSALLLVLPLASAARKGARWALDPILWGVWGTVCAIPQAWFFFAAFSERLFDVPSIHVALLVLGYACGLAGRWGYREVAESVSENPSTIAR